MGGGCVYSHHELKGVVWLIDRNNIQGFGRTENTLKLEPLLERLHVMGFEAIECHGHDFGSLDRVQVVLERSSRPGVIICKTTKGMGWKRYEDTIDCHYLPMKDDDYQSLKMEIELRYQESLEKL